MATKMKAISRRRFLQVAGATMLAAAVSIPSISGAKAKNGVKRVRVRPISSNNLRPGEVIFYDNARFATEADAMRAVASRRMTAEIYVEND